MEFQLEIHGTIVSGTSRNKSNISGNPKYNDKIKNICDLYGGLGEWTQEAYLYGGGRQLRAHSGTSIATGYGFSRPFEIEENNASIRSSRITIYLK